MTGGVPETLRDTHFAVVDVEGNGHSPASAILEMAIVPVDALVDDLL